MEKKKGEQEEWSGTGGGKKSRLLDGIFFPAAEEDGAGGPAAHRHENNQLQILFTHHLGSPNYPQTSTKNIIITLRLRTCTLRESVHVRLVCLLKGESLADPLFACSPLIAVVETLQAHLRSTTRRLVLLLLEGRLVQERFSRNTMSSYYLTCCT